jgi:glycosyltransferase involved in cell wall biosynthesis
MIPVRRRPAIVVPCFNEEARIDESEFVRLAKHGEIRLLFVDDGSTDETSALLHRMAVDTSAIDVLTLPKNCGKGEAVRRGLLEVLADGAPAVGYYDADMATPTDELLRLLSVLGSDPDLKVVIGSRVSLMGSSIRRTPMRHYLGRLYASIASLSVGTHIYDTQCGAKVFRNCPELTEALTRPFRATWAFDVELLDRLLHGDEHTPGLSLHSFVEVPLMAWRDVHGSKLSTLHAGKAMADVVGIGLRRVRRQPKVCHDYEPMHLL